MGTQDRLLDLETRRRVFKYVEKNPGMHLRGIQRGTAIPLGTVEYHLHQMEKSGLLVSRDDGRFKAFFVKEGLDRRDKDILYYVRQENPRRIVIHLLENPGATHTQIANVLPVGPSTVSFHLSKLVKAGMLDVQKQGRSKAFTVTESQRVADVLVRYRKSFLDDLVDRFASSWLGLEPAEGGEDAREEDEGGGPEPQGDPVAEPVPGKTRSKASPEPEDRRSVGLGVLAFLVRALRRAPSLARGARPADDRALNEGTTG